MQLAVMAAITVGSMILQSVTRPKPKQPPPVDKGRVDDVRIQGSEYGATIPIAKGKVRLAGNIIATSGVKERISITPGRRGGKGGGGSPPEPDTRNYTYTVSMAISICAGPVRNGIRRVWDESNVVLDLAARDGAGAIDNYYEAESLNNTLTNGARSGARVALFPAGSIAFPNVRTQRAQTAELTLYYSATQDVDVSIFTRPYEVGSYNVTLPATGGANTIGMYKLNLNFAAGTNSVTIVNQEAELWSSSLFIDKIFAFGGLPSDLDIDDTGEMERGATGILAPDADEETPQRDRFNFVAPHDELGVSEYTTASGAQATFRFYNGTEEQLQDARLVSLFSADFTPAYRGTCFVVVDELTMQEARLPNYTWEVDEGTTDLAGVVRDLHLLTGEYTEEQLDFLALRGITLDGLVAQQRTPLDDILTPLKTFFGFNLINLDGKVVAVLRGETETVAVIDESDLRAHEEGEDLPPTLEIQFPNERDLPRAVDVSYLDPALDYHQNVQQAQRTVGNTEDVEQITTPVVVSAARAHETGLRYLYARNLNG